MSLYLLSGYHVLTVAGAKAATFLQGQLTIDVNSITAYRATLAAHCNPKGRIIANFILGCMAPSLYYLIVPAELAPILKLTLQKYAAFSQVEVYDEPNNYQLIATQTPLVDASITLLLNYPSLSIAFCKQSIATSHDWKSYLIQHGIVMIDLNTSEQYTPQAIGFDLCGGVCFNKGCYTGQEIIARIHFRGQCKDGLYYADCVANSSPPTHTAVSDDSGPIGRVLMVADQGTDSYPILLNLRHQAADRTLVVEGYGQIENIKICSPRIPE